VTRAVSIAAALAAGGVTIALAATAAAPDAEAAPRGDGVFLPAGRFFDGRDQDRKVDERRGPFYGLRVHSMDAGGDATNVACFEYSCEGLRPDESPVRYDLVRTVYKVRVAPTDCDEVFGLPLPPAADVRGWRGVLGQTRWMRRHGPGATPIGGFVGRMFIAAVVGESEREIPAFDIRMAGTTGLRPMRGDPDDASARDDGRCTAPKHDEGWYVGRVDRRALLLFAKEHGDREGVLPMLRKIDQSALAGTFEGHLDVHVANDGTVDYCDIQRGAWWFDGLLAWKCRHARRGATDGAESTTEVQ